MTDHAAEARALVNAATEADPGADRDDIRTILNFAQVHATLALVEEQRTANLIALLTAASKATSVEALKQRVAVEDEILARLGLTPTTPNQEQ